METRFSTRAFAFIRTKEERYIHASPTRSKSRQNFAPGVFNSKLRGDRKGRALYIHRNFGINGEGGEGKETRDFCRKE